MNKVKITFLVFVVVSVLDIIGVIFKIPTLTYVFKPLILFSLIFLYVFSLPKRLKWYVIALELCFFGDVLLMFKGKLFFIAGLIFFLLAHLLFIKIVIGRLKKTSFTRIISSIIPFLILVSLLIFKIKDNLNEMLLPVIIYGLAISTFGVVSLIDFQNSRSKKSLLMLAGAIVFIVSDSVLAINKFYNATHLFEVIIMATYIIAQYLIFRSMLLETEKKLKFSTN